MSPRRQVVEATIRQRQGVLLWRQAQALKTGPVDAVMAQRFIWLGLLLRSLPHYSEDDLLAIQRLLA